MPATKKNKVPYIALFPGDWLKDDVAWCSMAAQGLWLRLMFLMHGAEPYGHLCVKGLPLGPDQLARRVGLTAEEFNPLWAELLAAGIPSRAENGAFYSRRMVDDHAKRQQIAEARRTAGGKGNIVRWGFKKKDGTDDT